MLVIVAFEIRSYFRHYFYECVVYLCGFQSEKLLLEDLKFARDLKLVAQSI